MGLVDRKLGTEGRTGNSSLKSSSKVSLQPAVLVGGGGLVAKSCLTLETPCIVARQAPLSMGSPGEDTEVGCHFLLQGILPTHRIPALQAGSILGNAQTRERPRESLSPLVPFL